MRSQANLYIERKKNNDVIVAEFVPRLFQCVEVTYFDFVIERNFAELF